MPTAKDLCRRPWAVGIGRESGSDISFNNLQGEVPDEGAFRNITYLAVAGNVNLCGGTPQLHLAPCPTSDLIKYKRKLPKSLVISLAIAGAILFTLSVILLGWVFCKKLKQSQKTLAQNSVDYSHYKRIPYHALLGGTNDCSEANLLERGSYGAVYKCVLDTEERTLAVKVFNLGQSRYTKSFEAEYLSARGRDFGISRILQENTSEGMQTSYGSTGLRGSIGYVAPEYGEGCAVSTAGDICSLGILLLEMFTGRSPTEGTFRDSLGLHKFVEDALPDRTLEIADPTIWLHNGENNNTTMLSLGISCSKQHPRDRALTRDATREIHAIRDAYLKFIGEHGAEPEASTQEIQSSVA
ncbi:hypothetical protein VPH35_114232 [Triticum aestivum]|uniref:Putative LRR receptor-like serine/threonine-protein kinase n=1 Tax=Aegilops tauschii TaxID=37682 RepID=R7WDP8_AEGTA